MKIGEILEKRKESWAELDTLCNDMLNPITLNAKKSSQVIRLSALYRAACSDLAMADVYQLPASTVSYLHALVGRAHNILYRSQSFRMQDWSKILFEDAPRQIFSDWCVQAVSLVFFGLFILSAIIAASPEQFPTYADRIVGKEMLGQMEEMYAEELDRDHFEEYAAAAAGYISHNTGIGLQCFGFGILIIPSFCTLAFNGIFLGAIFGYMTRPDVMSGDHFLQFVTAHGPFELTAIALSGAAGIRVGVGFWVTGGLTRVDSLRLQGIKAMPVIMAAVVLFVLAAFTEGFISPSPLPYPIKALWAIASSGAMMYYFVVLGFPRRTESGV